MLGTAVIPSGYSDEYGQPKELDDNTHKKYAAAVAVGNVYDEDAAEFDPTRQFAPEIAAQAFELATEKFNSLDAKVRDKTSIGAIAIQFATALEARGKQEAVRQPAVKISEADLPPAKTKTKTKTKRTTKKVAEMISPAPVIEVATPVKRTKTVKRVIKVKKPAPVMDAEEDSGFIAVRRPSPKKVVSGPSDAAKALASLQIPRLGSVPTKPDIEVVIRYTEQSQLVTQRFRVHWLLTYLDDNDQVTQVDMTFDRRYGESPFDDLEIEFSPYESMQLSIDGSRTMTLEVLRGKMTVDLGVFSTAIFNVVRP